MYATLMVRSVFRTKEVETNSLNFIHSVKTRFFRIYNIEQFMYASVKGTTFLILMIQNEI